MAEGALLVVSDPAGWSRPEPGVRRLPSLEEQFRALARWGTRLGLAMHPHPLVLGSGDRSAARSIVAASAADPAVTAMLFISTECVSSLDGIDLDAVSRVWAEVEILGFLVEDLVVSSDASFDDLTRMLLVIGNVRTRDSDPAWARVVAALGPMASKR